MEYCTSPAGSTGAPATVEAFGSQQENTEFLTIRAQGLPQGSLALLFVGTAAANQTAGNGTLCVGAVGLEDQAALALEAFQKDALGTARIEGEELAPDSVRSSIARRLGLTDEALAPSPRHVEGLVEVLDDATRHHRQPLTADRLFGWHAALFPAGFSHLRPITVGAWRKDRIVVQSGWTGSETIHFEAPAPERLDEEMGGFLAWWNGAALKDSALKAGLAHLWLETIHPFDDGNGRIGRALVDMALAAGDNSLLRYYSVSAQILKERAGYYRALEEAQRGTLDVTEWLAWFLSCALSAVREAESGVKVATLRARLRAELPIAELSQRQTKALHRLIEHEPVGFEGGLTNAKYCSMTGASRATASRDLADL